MAATSVAVPAARANGVGPFLHGLVPVWSRPAAYRAARATLVIPSLFAICSRVIGNDQMALYASFGGFATLVLATFGGSRREKLVAYVALAAAGSLLIVIGTAVSGTVAVAAIVAFVVAFCVLFCGIIGPNVVSGATAVLLAFVLPVSSPGLLAAVPWRLAGWLLASAAGTIAVLVLPPPPAGDRVRSSAAASASALADEIDAGLRGEERADAGRAPWTPKWRCTTPSSTRPCARSGSGRPTRRSPTSSKRSSGARRSAPRPSPRRTT